MILTPVLITPHAARVLRPGAMGTVSFAESVVSYFVLLAGFGVASHGQREISYVQGDKYKRSVIFWNTKLLQLFTSLVSLALYLFFALKTGRGYIYIVYAINILTIVFDLSWLYQGEELFDKIAVRNIVCQLLSIAFVYILVKDAGDTVLYIFGISFFSFLAQLSLWINLPELICRVDKSEIKPFKSFGSAAALFVPSIAIQIYTVLDRTMLGIITKDSFENAYYQQAMLIPRGLLVVVTAFGTVLIPRIGASFASGNTDEVKKLIYRNYKAVWFLAVPFFLGLILTADYFVPWFYGPGYSRVASLIKVAAPIILFIGINTTTALSCLVPTKREKVFTKAVLIGAAANFCLNIFCIKIWKAAGAAGASVFAELLINVIEFRALKGEISVKQVLKESRNYWISGLAMVAAVLCFERYVETKPTIIWTAVIVFLGAISYVLVLSLLGDSVFEKAWGILWHTLLSPVFTHCLFYISYALAIAAEIMRRSLYASMGNLKIVFIGMLGLGCCLALLKLLMDLILRRIRWKLLILMLAGFAFTVFIFLRGQNDAWMVLWIFICSSWDVKFKNISALAAVSIMGAVLFVFVSAKLGIIENIFVWGGEWREQRFAMGFAAFYHAAYFSSFALMAWFYWRKEKAWCIEIIGGMALAWIVYKQSYTRGPLLIDIALFAAVIILKDFKSVRNYHFLYTAAGIVFPLGVFYAVTIQGIKYNPAEIEILGKIDKMVSGRLHLNYEAVRSFPIKLLGSPVKWYTGDGTDGVWEFNWVDSAYLYSLLSYGIIFMAFVMAVSIIMAVKAHKKRDTYMIVMLVLVAVMAFWDNYMFRIECNPFALFLSYLISDKEEPVFRAASRTTSLPFP